MPKITAIATSNPPFSISQDRIVEFMKDNLDWDDEKKRKLEILYRASGISNRFTVLEDYNAQVNDFTFFPDNAALEPFPTVSQRMEKYKSEALKLSLEAICKAFEQVTYNPVDTTHLITVSCTGLYAPGLDIELIEALELSPNTPRTAINFMGCYAAFNAIRTANQICNSEPKAKVLVICTEICSLHFQKEFTEDYLLANSLFSDGSAAVIIENEQSGLSIESFYSDLFLEGKNEMTWNIGDFGFNMKLSTTVPKFVEEGMKKLGKRLRGQLNGDKIDYYCIHPGGRRILEASEKALNITKAQNEWAYHVLRNYGNMSSPTILFVIERLLESHSLVDGESVLCAAFGPGLSLESMILRKS